MESHSMPAARYIPSLDGEPEKQTKALQALHDAPPLR